MSRGETPFEIGSCEIGLPSGLDRTALRNSHHLSLSLQTEPPKFGVAFFLDLDKNNRNIYISYIKYTEYTEIIIMYGGKKMLRHDSRHFETLTTRRVEGNAKVQSEIAT